MCGLTNRKASGQLPYSTSKLISVSLHTFPIVIKISPSHAAVGVGRLLFPIFALALDLPGDFFDDKVEYKLYLKS